MSDKTPISKAALHAILTREFDLLKSPGCERCEPLMPKRLGAGAEWVSAIPQCPSGCHRELNFLVRVFSQQYRLRDLCDTLG